MKLERTEAEKRKRREAVQFEAVRVQFVGRSSSLTRNLEVARLPGHRVAIFGEGQPPASQVPPVPLLHRKSCSFYVFCCVCVVRLKSMSFF